MKLIDYLIVASLIGCMFIGYSGHRLIAGLLFLLIAIVASWRFWDRRREKQMMRTGSSGELTPSMITALSVIATLRVETLEVTIDAA